MALTLILVRHGESFANRDKFFAGQLDVKLTEKGTLQAEATARYIAEIYHIDKIYSSSLCRAYDTAIALQKLTGISPIMSDGMREIYSGAWQGLHFDELQTQYADSYSIWLHDIGRAKCPDGESIAELYERVWKTIDSIKKDNPSSTVAITTHATPIRAIMCKIQGLPAEKMADIPWVSNASVTVVSFDGEDWHIDLNSYDAHLDNLKTYFPPNV